MSTLPVKVHIVRPGVVVRRTHQGSYQLDGVQFYAYDRLATELEEAGGVKVALVDRAELPNESGVLFHQSVDTLEACSATVRGHAMLLEADRNSFLRVAKLGLLGAVTWDGMQKWRTDDRSELGRSLVGRRDVAESMEAVGDRILGPYTYCYLSRSDWTSLPNAISQYLHHLR